jgi:hypothetical protein
MTCPSLAFSQLQQALAELVAAEAGQPYRRQVAAEKLLAAAEATARQHRAIAAAMQEMGELSAGCPACGSHDHENCATRAGRRSQ